MSAYSSIFQNVQFSAVFFRHLDADLGSIIHLFYEKQNEWCINSPTSFLEKWEEKIYQLNCLYKKKIYKEDFIPFNDIQNSIRLRNTHF